MKIGVFIPRLPTKLKPITTIDYLYYYANVFVCVPNGMQNVEKYPTGISVLPIGGDIVTARNNIMQYAQKHKYDAIWVIDDDLNRFMTVIKDVPTNTKFTPYAMNCRMGGISMPFFMKDTYERYGKQGRVKHGMVFSMMYFEDLSLRYRDREKYGHEDCDLYIRLALEGYEPVIDTTHFKSHANNAKMSLTNSNNPKYDWLLYREWGDIINFNKHMSVSVDKKLVNSPKTHTKYSTDIREFMKMALERKGRSYDIDQMIEKVSKNLRSI